MTSSADDERRQQSDRELFDRIAASYTRKDIVANTRIARRAILLRALAPLLANGASLGTVVDIGCGPGGQALHLAGRFDRYVGIDHSGAMIEAARELTAHLRGVEFVCANANSPDLPSGIADVVLSVGVLHHMPGYAEVVRNLARVAKPGAAFVAIEPHRGNPVIQLLRWLRARLDSDYSADQEFFSKAELAQGLADGGLTDIRLSYQSFLTQPFGQVILPPQWLSAPMARLAVAVEPAVEFLFPGRLSWLLVAYGKFPGRH